MGAAIGGGGGGGGGGRDPTSLTPLNSLSTDESLPKSVRTKNYNNNITFKLIHVM